MINENYHGEIYHFTSLVQASWIIDDNGLFPNISSCEGINAPYRNDNRKYANDDMPYISFTRDKNYHIQGDSGTVVCFVFDGDAIQNLRNARLYPYAYDTRGRHESEERLFGVAIRPLHKFVKRIEIKVSNALNSWMSDRDFDDEWDIQDEMEAKYPNLNEKEISDKITEFLLKKISENKLFKDKVVIRNNINCNTKKRTLIISEAHMKSVIQKLLKEYFEINPECTFGSGQYDAPKTYEAIDFATIMNIIQENNWECHKYWSVDVPGGQRAIRYRISPLNGAVNIKELVRELKSRAIEPNGIKITAGSHSYPSPNQKYSIYVYIYNN